MKLEICLRQRRVWSCGVGMLLFDVGGGGGRENGVDTDRSTKLKWFKCQECLWFHRSDVPNRKQRKRKKTQPQEMS